MVQELTEDGVQVVADADPHALPRKIDRAHKRLRRVRAGAPLRPPADLPGEDEDAWAAFARDVLFATAPSEEVYGRVIRADVQVRHVILVAGP